jgi:hypothetical protein
MWLTKALDTILREMIAAEDREDFEEAEIVCDGGLCYVGDRRIHKGSVYRLLQLMAIKDVSDTKGCERYRVNDMGRSIVRRPAIIQELARALIDKKSYTIKDDRIVMLDGSHT